jgi:BMFP domain-containing protein YqiC
MYALFWTLAFRGKQRKMRLVFSPHLRYQIAMTKESVENIARKLAEAVPEGLKSMREDLEGNFRSVLQTSLAKLDLVTREEFEVQEAVLAKTRSKLDALEARLREIEEEQT